MNEDLNNIADYGTLPEGWARAKLSDIARINMGQSPPGTTYNECGEGMPFFQGKADFGIRYPKVRVWCTKPLKIASPGDVLISVRAPVGPTNVADRMCVIGRGLAALSLLGSIPSEIMLFQLRLLEPVLLLSGTGSTFTAIQRQYLEDINIVIPPLAEQKRIVAKVEELLPKANAAKERLKRASQIMKHFRQAVLSAACTGRLTEGWREENQGDESAIEQLRVLNTERRKFPEAKHYRNHESRESTGEEEIPDNWVWTSVDSIAIKVVDGVHKKPEYVSDGIPFITVRNLTKGSGIDFEKVNYVSEIDHKQFIHRANPEQGDILVTKDGTLGVVRAIRTDRIFSIFVSVALIKPVSRSLTDYLELALSSPLVQSLMVATGSGLQHIHLRDLRNTYLPFPPLSEQREIVNRVKRLFHLADAIEKRIEAAKIRTDKLTQSILAKAFRGELIPTEAELAHQEGRSYEPASILLERVKAEREKRLSGSHQVSRR